ncbi:MAG: acyl-CoA thioesterase [Pseudanabaenaceae cyanobacterium]
MGLVYRVAVFPHHTDYAGVVWHGTYITWLEEARVLWLQQAGINYADLVAAGVELPVVAMSLKYHRPARMGDHLDIHGRCNRTGVRLIWYYQIYKDSTICVSGEVTLAPVDMEKGKILRHLPDPLGQAIEQILQNS